MKSITVKLLQYNSVPTDNLCSKKGNFPEIFQRNPLERDARYDPNPHFEKGWKNIGVVPDHVQQNNILKAIKQSERRGIAESRYDRFEKHYKNLKTHGFDEWDLYFHEQNIKENVIRSFINYYVFSIFLSFLLSNSLIKNCFFILVNKVKSYDNPCAKDIIDQNIGILCKTKRKQVFREKRGRIREIKKEKIPP